MPHYKNSQNQLYWLDPSDDPIKWLPADCVEISEEETEAIRISQIPPTPVPTQLTMRQTRLALLHAGLLDTVSSGVSQMSKASQIEWEFASSVTRDNPLVFTIAQTLGLSEVDLDNLFIEGSKL